MNPVRYAAADDRPSLIDASLKPHAKTSRQAAKTQSMAAKGTRAGEPISPIRLTVSLTELYPGTMKGSSKRPAQSTRAAMIPKASRDRSVMIRLLLPCACCAVSASLLRFRKRPEPIEPRKFDAAQAI